MASRLLSPSRYGSSSLASCSGIVARTQDFADVSLREIHPLRGPEISISHRTEQILSMNLCHHTRHSFPSVFHCEMYQNRGIGPCSRSFPVFTFAVSAGSSYKSPPQFQLSHLCVPIFPRGTDVRLPEMGPEKCAHLSSRGLHSPASTGAAAVVAIGVPPRILAIVHSRLSCIMVDLAMCRNPVDCADLPGRQKTLAWTKCLRATYAQVSALPSGWGLEAFVFFE
jgi:hypothetical protein